MDLAAYLGRIGYAGPLRPDLETLRGMHRAHFYTVAFENLDIQRQVPIVVDLAENYGKVVERGRGGWCMELSALFAWALREIGFRVDILGARVLSPLGQLGEPNTHMTLLVHLDEPWLADVGFGGRHIAPLRMAERGPQEFEGRTYAVANDGDHWFASSSDAWVAPTAARTYVFTLQPRELPEFERACRWLQVSPESHFTRGDVVSLATPNGRKTYSAGRLLVAEGETRTESAVAAVDLPRVLLEEFGVWL